MQYSPKLKKAMEEIKKIVKKYDIGAMVILHTPGFSEFLNHVDPSYSVVQVVKDGIRFKTTGRSHQDVSDSYNMIAIFRDMTVMHADLYTRMAENLAKKLDAEEDDGDLSDHTTQNN